MTEPIQNIAPTSDLYMELASIEHVTEESIKESIARLVCSAEKARERETRDVDSGITSDATGEYDQLPLFFVPYYQRRPSEAESMMADLKHARNHLSSSSIDQIDSISNAVARWGGKSRDAFDTHFLAPFPKSVSNQQLVIAELESALATYIGLLRSGRQEAKRIAEITADVLDAHRNFSDSSEQEAKFLLACVAAVAGLLSAATGGAGLVALAFIGGVSSTIPAIMDMLSVDQEVYIKGGTVKEILASMIQALSSLSLNMKEAENTIAAYLREDSSAIRGILDSVDNDIDIASGSRNVLVVREPEDDVTDLASGEPVSADLFGPRK